MTSLKKFATILLPALALAATVGLTAMGCSDDTTTTKPQDLSVAQDLTTAGDLAE